MSNQKLDGVSQTLLCGTHFSRLFFLFPSCIDKWLKGQGAGKCPQCNAKSKRADIRVIYAKAVSVVDTTDRDRALKVKRGRREEREERGRGRKEVHDGVLL